ncbi:MAG TPA: hypothetical protein VFN83_09995 [Gemmatimonadales bacterium]|nr:hypothetical protein [Gemmatimonadales bacterium]
MSHLTMEQLVALREPGSEPGQASAREHLAECGRCAAELDRLHQRVAHLRALPTLRPSRDLWSRVDARRRADRRARRWRQSAGAGLAVAASLAGFMVLRPMLAHPNAADAEVTQAAIAEARAQSASLQQMLESYDPEGRVINGRTASVAQVLEDRIAQVDQRIQAVELAPGAPASAPERLDLWRQRVGLLDALVDVHVTQASNVGF